MAGRSHVLGHPLASRPRNRLVFLINNPLKSNVIYCPFRAKTALLHNVAARGAPAVSSPVPRNRRSLRLRVSHAVQRRRRMAAQAVSFRRAGLFRGRMPMLGQATFASLRAEHWTRLGDVTPEDAYTLHLNCRSSTSISLYGRYGGRERHNIPFSGATLFDLSLADGRGGRAIRHVAGLPPARRMISLAESMARRSDVRLRLPKPGFDDCIVKNLLNIIDFALDNPERTSQLFIDEISVLLMSHLIHSYSDVSPVQPRTRGGLASWQERIAKEILVRANPNPPTIDELSQACGVSARHFIRSFRQSTGRTPHQWLMQERALSAKNLVEHSDRTLAEISAICGYANQSHLCRAFQRSFGHSPLNRAAVGKGGRVRRFRTAGRRACPWTFAKAFFKAGVVVRAAPKISIRRRRRPGGVRPDVAWNCPWAFVGRRKGAEGASGLSHKWAETRGSGHIFVSGNKALSAGPARPLGRVAVHGCQPATSEGEDRRHVHSFADNFDIGA